VWQVGWPETNRIRSISDMKIPENPTMGWSGPRARQFSQYGPLRSAEAATLTVTQGVAPSRRAWGRARRHTPIEIRPRSPLSGLCDTSSSRAAGSLLKLNVCNVTVPCWLRRVSLLPPQARSRSYSATEGALVTLRLARPHRHGRLCMPTLVTTALVRVPARCEHRQV
jgi:hypothetical protein